MRRRRFLIWSGLGAVAGGLALVRARGYHVPAEVAARLKVLSPWQYRVLEAVGARVLDPEHADVAGFADGYLEDLADADRTDLLRLLAVVEHALPMRLGHLSRFTELSPTAQDEVLSWLELAPIPLLRGGFAALKALAMMAYYRLEASWPAIGYSGPVVLYPRVKP
jgi:hypothetical protein